MRLINDEQLKHLLNDSEYYGTHAWDDFCDMINECDAVDAVPVVRCVECKYNGRCMLQEFVKDNSVRPFNENVFYCPDGERKENAAC